MCVCVCEVCVCVCECVRYVSVVCEKNISSFLVS